MNEKKPVVLFLCSGNSCRSQMAEAILRKRAGDRFEVHSAGLSPTPINPFTYTVMEEVGLNMDGQYAKGVDKYLGKLPVRHLIIVCSGAAKACPSVWPGVVNRELWPFEDPAVADSSDEEKLAVFRRVRDQIEARIMEWLDQMEKG
jgi:arsenate reductase